MTHAIFEREGILIDCTIPDPCKDSVIFKRFDRHIPHTLSTYFMPDQMDKTCELLAQGISAPFDRVTFNSVYHKTLRAESWRTSDVQAGVLDLLSTLRENSIPMAMVSHHASADAVVHITKYRHLMEYFETKIFRDDPEASLDFFSPDQLRDGLVPPRRSPVQLACERFVEAAVPGRNVIAFAKSAAFAVDALRAGLFVAWLADPKSHVLNLSFPERLRVG
ncbi:unnamed protein product [Taenia asiatica]|uniref:HAD family hydrolase n=1 Tax=Taenia asiatica TaxID=60517 RepID=A0A0R3WDT7_TAEAS|nr:unnamed protein product [Taenia asiatica]